MKSLLIVLFALASAPYILADIDFEHILPAEEPQVPSKPSDEWDFIGNLMDAVKRKVAAPHIVGGFEVEPHIYPHQVAITALHPGKKIALCGGSLIAPEWVLTAAHCTTDVQALTVSLGSHDISKPENTRQKIRVKSFYLPKAWSIRAIANDIALLKLSQPATLNKYVKTIRLPSASQREWDLSGSEVQVAGWGRFSDNQMSISPVLRAASTSVITNSVCKQSFGAAITKLQVCADGSGTKGVCQGDSGGPMLLTEEDGERTVVGITSFGRREGCERGFPTVFTRVDAYLEWIYRVIGKQPQN